MFTFDPENHIYRVDGSIVTSVTQAMDDIVDKRWFTDEGRERGQAVHAAIEFKNDGDLDEDSIHPTIAPYVQASDKFDRESGFVSILCERKGYHPRHRYCGKPDKIGMLNGRPAVIDYKTGKPQDWAAVQTAAYKELIPYLEGYDDKSEFAELMRKHSVRRFGLELRANATYRLTDEYKNRNDFRVFLACLTVSNWNRGQRRQ